MAINFNNQNQGIGTLDLSQFGLMQPQNQNMQVADAYNTPTEGEYGFNLIQLDRLKNAGYDPAELSTYPNQEDVQSIIRNLEPTSMSISNYDQLFGPKTMSDANQSLYTGVMDRSGTPIGEDIDMQYTNDSFNVEPQYRIRDQLNRDFLQGGLFRDAKNSLGETFGPIKNKIGSGLGSLKDFAMNKGTQGFNLAKQIPGMALSAMTGIPGIGMILGALGNMGSNEYAQATTANMQKQNNNLQGLGLDGVSNFGGVTTDDLGRITNNGLNYNTPEGIMSGYNSGFDLASSALGRIGKIQDSLALGKFKNVNKANQKINNLKTAAVASAQAKRQAYQDKMDRAKNSAARERARAKSITAGYGGGNDNDRPSTGPTSVGAGMGVGGGYASDYGFLKDGGSVGLASMFTRRR